MKKIFRTVAALAVVLFAGCTQDLDNEVVAPVGGTTVTVGLEDSRTYLGDLVDGARKVFWSSDDKIAVNGVASTAIERTEDHTSADFTVDGELAYPYSILYPAEAYKDASTVTLATNDIPMAGYLASEGSAVLHHLAAVVRLQVKLPAESTHAVHALNKVEVRGLNGEQMAGDFTIDYQTETLVGASTADADKVKVANVGKTLSAEQAIEVFVVVPAQEYAGGLSVRLFDDAGHFMDVKSAPMTIAKGEIKAMPVLEFAPTGTIIGVEIKTAAELVAFAKAYNAGDYFGVEPFVVHITDDIVFDDATSAEWESIGNIFGADNKLGLEEGATNYWHGWLEGNGHSIKNWVSSFPLFGYTGGGSMVTNLTIDASCTLTANYKDNVNYFGALVGYHRGNLVNCVNNANITVSGAWDSDMHVGGLIGRTVIGQTKNCVNNGNITLTDDVALVGKTVYIGGIAGRMSNADGAIYDTTNNGAIVLAGSNVSTADSYKLYVAGISGHCAGTISGCTNAATGVISGEMTVPYHCVGGIAGAIYEGASVVNSVNNASFAYDPAATRNGDTNGRYLYMGGITGLCDGEAIGNTNNGSLSSASSVKFVYIGGAVGFITSEGAVVKNNNVSKDVLLNATGKGRYVGIGGLVGAMAAGAILDLKDDTGKIECTVKGGAIESTSYAPGVGGVVGYIHSASTVKNVKNWTGTLHVDASIKTCGSEAGYGCLVGYAVSGCTIENCQVDGKFVTTFTVALSGSASIGGIIGLTAGATTVKDCTCNTDLQMTAQTTSSKKMPLFLGGIIGKASSKDVVITNCHNTQSMWNRHYNNSGYTDASSMKANYVGGIIGVYASINVTPSAAHLLSIR